MGHWGAYRDTARDIARKVWSGTRRFIARDVRVQGPQRPARDVWTTAVGLAAKLDCTTVIDVGANCGDTIRKFRDAFPNARIFGIEPDPAIFPALARRYSTDSRVSLHQLALGEQAAPGVLHQGTSSTISSLFPRNQSGHRYFRSDLVMANQIPVALQTLDRFCADQGLGQINLLKMDTQGGEFGIIQGAQNLLSRGAIDVIVTEFFFIPHYEGAPLLNQIWTGLLRHGYHIFDLFHGSYGADGYGADDQARFGDAIFVSPGFRARFLGSATCSKPRPTR
jgi:FkbM family methyltransferase